MAADSIRLRLHLSQVRVIGVMEETPEKLDIAVESTTPTCRCPECGARCVRVHDRRLRKIRDLRICGKAVTLLWRRRRFACDACGKLHLEPHPHAFGDKMTTRLERQIVQDVKEMTFTAVAKRHGLSWYAVNKIVRWWAGLLLHIPAASAVRSVAGG